MHALVNILAHKKDSGDDDVNNSIQHIYKYMQQTKLLTQV